MLHTVDARLTADLAVMAQEVTSISDLPHPTFQTLEIK